MKKLLSILLASLMAFSLVALVGCNKEEESSSLPAAPSAASSSEPEPEPEPVDPAYLTGLPKGDDYPEGKRMAAVMVNNIAASRPYQGLSEADMLVEMVTEGGISRFMALFQSYDAAPQTGSVRSLRDQFFRIMYPTEAFIVHAGESATARQYLDRYAYEPYNLGNESPLYLWRIQRPGMLHEYTAYTSGEGIASYVTENGMDPNKTYEGTFFNFVPYDEDARAIDSLEMNSVLVTHSFSYKSQFDYDAASGLYNMSQSDEAGNIYPAIDEGNGVQLAFANILVLFTGISMYDGGTVPNFDLTGGTGYYMNGGRFEQITWQKGNAEDDLKLFDASGAELQLNPGKCYLSVVGADNQADFEASLPVATPDASASGDVAEP